MNENGIGGFKEVSFMINGQGAYSRLKYESGVHRVQRIPASCALDCSKSYKRARSTLIALSLFLSCDFSSWQEITIPVGICVNRTAESVVFTHWPPFPEAHDAEAELRKSQIGTGDRAEKIRTYNFPQGRVTDHRIKLTLHRLDDILNGDLDEIIDSLTAADQAAKLSKLQEMER